MGLGRQLQVSAFLVLIATGAAAQDAIAPGGPSTAASVGSDAPALQPTVERVVGEVVAREAIPGLIVGVSWHGRRSYFGYGATGAKPYGPDTIVEIGSITKVFTTALFAEALAEGRMQREAPIQSYLPHVALRPCAGQVTPLQLADFTSGMPTLPADVPRQLAARGMESYTREDFFRWLSGWTPADGCGRPAPYRYSNASVGLLGYLVAHRLGAPWQQLVRDRITGPLRMTSTAMEVRPDQRDRVAQGFGKDGQPVIPWPVFAWYAAGALRSTASDMLAFGEAALGHERVNDTAVPLPLIRALQDAMAPIYQPDGEDFGQGMAWTEKVGDPDAGQRPVFLKAGGTDGFNSVIVVNPGKDMAVFIAASRPDSGIPKLGVALSRQLRP